MQQDAQQLRASSGSHKADQLSCWTSFLTRRATCGVCSAFQLDRQGRALAAFDMYERIAAELFQVRGFYRSVPAANRFSITRSGKRCRSRFAISKRIVSNGMLLTEEVSRACREPEPDELPALLRWSHKGNPGATPQGSEL